jgi:hypothetical protein
VSESESGIESGISFELVDLSKLSFEALDDLLSRSSVQIESEDELLTLILKLGFSDGFLVRHIQIGFLSEEDLSLLSDHLEIPPESVWELSVESILHRHPPSGQFDSQIISELPGILADFSREQFKVLWRGSRDGFSASEFHCRCDGHANTLTVIFDTNGNIIGGFTALKWESPQWNGKQGKENNFAKADDSEKSFTFTLKNVHKVGERRFGLKSEEKWRAISCVDGCGPCLGYCDIFISDHSNANTDSRSDGFGQTYANDTGLNGRTFLSGSEHFRAKEIEVFEITN